MSRPDSLDEVVVALRGSIVPMIRPTFIFMNASGDAALRTQAYTDTVAAYETGIKARVI